MALTKEEILELFKRITEFEEKIDDIDVDDDESPPPEELKKLIGSLSVTFDEFLDKVVERDTNKFSNFLENVGNSFVEAQKKLDVASKDYLAQTSDSKYILPSTFRIPKISADIKFAMKETSQEGFNMVIYKDVNTAETGHQQSVHFEMVSVPPTVEAQQELQRLIPRMNFVLSPRDREAVFGLLEKAPLQSNTPKLKKEREFILLKENRNRVLIAPSETQQGFFFMLPDITIDGKAYMGLWYLPEAIDEGFQLVLRDATQDKEKKLQEAILAFIKKQEKVIAEFSGNQV